MGMSLQPSTQSFAPRQMAARRPATPQGDGTPQANGLQTQPKPFSTAHPPAPQPHPAAPQAPQTFAQMQSAGQARPNPPQASMGSGYTSSGGAQAPMASGTSDDTPQQAAKDWTKYTTHTLRPLTDAELAAKGYTMTNPNPNAPWTKPSEMGDFMQTPDGDAITLDEYDRLRGGNLPTSDGNGGWNWSYAQPQQPQEQGRTLQNGVVTPLPSQAAPSGVQGDLQSAIQQALQSPSRFDAGAYKQMRDASMGTLKQQFGADQQALDEEMARRGLGASTIGSQYQTNLKGQQDTAIAGLDASLLKDAADNWAADRNGAIGAAQAFQNGQDANSQFARNLAQQLGIAQMGDKTQNRGIDAQSALANNDLMLRVMAALGLGGGGSGGTTPTGQTTTTSTNPAGDPPGTIRNADGTIARTGGGSTDPNAGGGGALQTGGAAQNTASGWYWDADGNLRMR